MPEKTIAQMLDEYNKLGEERLVKQFGASFRPRSSFKDKSDAIKSLAKLNDQIAASEAGYAAQEAQPGDANPGKEVVSAEGEEAMTANGRKKPKSKTVKSKTAARRGRASAYPETAKISVLVKDNPRREGTAVYKQFELAKKHATVGAYLKAGGSLGSLRKGIKRQWLKVV